MKSKSSKSRPWIVAVRAHVGASVEWFEFERKSDATSFAESVRKKRGFEAVIARKEKKQCRRA